MSQIKITSTPVSSSPQIGISSVSPSDSSSIKTIPFPGQRGEPGPQGIQGIQGLQGIQGDKGDIGGVYEHNQSSVSDVWVVEHNLGYNPNVTIVDSGGNVVEAELWYNNFNSLEVRFSHGMSGKAYIS
jgi:hypothetical protein